MVGFTFLIWCSFLLHFVVYGRGANCGFHHDCPRAYSLVQVNESAAQWEMFDPVGRQELAKRKSWNERVCSNQTEIIKTKSTNVGETGGWCLNKGFGHLYQYGPNPEHRYFLPSHHVPADDCIVDLLLNLTTPLPGKKKRQSIADFGAGVGQYGRTLLLHDPKVRYAGYDGAGNIADITDNFLQFFDLTIPLSLPKADWVVSLEVGEHIPNEHEMNVIRNLHAHNCRGIVLSWAVLGQQGRFHVNNHDKKYIISTFEQLGYIYREDIVRQYMLTRSNPDTLRGSLPSRPNPNPIVHSWFNSLHVFERIQPTNDCY